jgi:hypothetical protein
LDADKQPDAQDRLKRRDHAAEASTAGGSFGSTMQARGGLVLPPRFASILPEFLDLVRFLLDQSQLSPQALTVVVQAFCACVGYRAETDVPAVACHLEGKDRTGVGGLIEDMLGHPLIGRTTERALRRILEAKEPADKRTQEGSRELEMVCGALACVILPQQ